MMTASQLHGSLFAALFAALGLLAVGLGMSWLLAYLMAINLTTLAAYGYDKLAARADRAGRRARVPERIMHALALAGGSPAALIAQRWWRHKTAKTGFQRAYWLIVAAQVVLLAFWLWRELT